MPPFSQKVISGLLLLLLLLPAMLNCRSCCMLQHATFQSNRDKKFKSLGTLELRPGSGDLGARSCENIITIILRVR
jgi:hypothetical protein